MTDPTQINWGAIEIMFDPPSQQERATACAHAILRLTTEDWSPRGPLGPAIVVPINERANLEALASRLLELEKEMQRARTVVGEGWFAGDCSLAQAILKKCRVLEGKP